MTNYSEIIAKLSPEKRRLLEMRLKKEGSEYNTFPLSFSQQRLWFLDQLEPGSPVYNIPSAVRLTGELNITALEHCIHEIVKRHEILRTTFTSVNGQAAQIIAPQLSLHIPQIDLSEIPESEQENHVEQLAGEEARKPFDLSRGPLMRVTLLCLREDDYVVLFSMHHIISDGWSMGVLIREIAVLYDAFVNGKSSPLPKLTLQYADYARWQQRRLSGPVMETQLDYWKKQLGNDDSILELPLDYSRPAVKTYNGSYVTFKLSRKLTNSLNNLSRQAGCTPFMTLLAAFQTLLFRYTGQEEISIGSPIANRTRAETEGLIGFFVNTLVLRSNLSGNQSFNSLLKQVREVTLGAYAHQDLPFEKLVEVVQPDRDMSHSPLFQVMFVLQNTPNQAIKLQNLTMQMLEAERGVAKFDLTLNMGEGPDGLGGLLEYNTDLFQKSTIQRMLKHFEILLKGIVAEPEQPISDLSLLTKAEETYLICDLNKTQKDFPRDLCLPQLFEAQVEKTPDATAVVFEEEKLTYRELNQRSNQMAFHLQQLGVGPEVFVGICVKRSMEMLIGVLGILKAGGAYLPLDHKYPNDRMAYILEDSQTQILLTQAELYDKLSGYSVQLVNLDSELDKIAQQSIKNPVSKIHPQNSCYVIYTSGSTGRPKGVVIEHQSFVNYLHWVNEELFKNTDIILPSVTNITFDASLKQLFAPLLRGEICLIYADDLVTQPALLVEEFAKHTRRGFNSVPALWSTIIDHIESDNISLPQDCLTRLYLGGESLSPELINRTVKIFSNIRIWNIYGPTETTANSSFIELESEKKISIGRPLANTQIYILNSNLKPVPVGVRGEMHIGGNGVARGYLNRPDLSAQSFIPDPFSKQPGARFYKTGDLVRYLPDGNIEFIGRIDHQVKIRGFRIELGEIETQLEKYAEIKEAVVLAREDTPGNKRLVAYCIPKSAQPMVENEQRSQLRIPFNSQAFLDVDSIDTIQIRTEDLSLGGVRISKDSAGHNFNGVKQIRFTFQLPGSAEKIELESHLVWENGNRIGLAFDNIPSVEKSAIEKIISQLHGDDQVSIRELRNYLADSLPEYMVPTAFVMLDEMPLTATGKIDRRALPAPSQERTDLQAEFVAPRNPAEEILAGIWSQILEVNQIGVHDNFFEVGGHSLIATKLVSRIRDAFEVELPLRALFEQPTIAGLANVIEETRHKEQNLNIPPIRRVSREELLPLSFGQQRLWFLDQLTPGSSLYNIPDVLRLNGELNIPALELSIQEIVRRHESLRTTFLTTEGQPQQVIHAEVTFNLPVIDLQKTPPKERPAAARHLIKEEAQKPFDLSKGPLLRVSLLRLSPIEHILLATMHHIISDGWSTGVLIKELSLLYPAFCEGKSAPLPELAIQYADYAHWQRNWLKGEVLEEQLGYWKKQLGEHPAVLELPTDYARPATRSNRGAYEVFTIPSHLVNGLEKLSRQAGATMFMTLLAAFQTFLFRYSGQDDFNVGTPIAGRTRRETEELIGFFINTLVIHADLSGKPSFSELLKIVKETTLDAYRHQDIPFEKLVDELQPERDLSHTPLFQVMFNFQDTAEQTLKLPGLTLSAVEAELGSTKFDLTLSIISNRMGLSGALQYDKDLFQKTTVERMIKHFQTLLEAIIAEPDQSVTLLQIIGQAEEKQLLLELNQTDLIYPPEVCVHQMFEAQVERTPDALALVSGNERLTFQELNRRANQVAHFLQKQGVGPDQFVGLCMERSAEMIVGLLGILKAGGAYMPLDPNYPKERLIYMLKNARAHVLLTQQQVFENLPEHAGRVVCIDSEWENIVRESTENCNSKVSSENLAYAIYTSGSTGRPKGVMIRHDAVINLFTGLHQKIYHSYSEKQLNISLNGPLAFDTSVKQVIMLLGGHVLHVVPQTVRYDGNELLSFIRNSKLDVFDCTPSQLKILIEAGLLDSGEYKPALILPGGEPLDHKTWEVLAKNEEIDFYNMYGPTECTVDTTIAQIQTNLNKPTIGRPISNIKIYLLDSNLNPVPFGVAGEICVGGAGLARGYHHDPERTAEKFIPNPFSNKLGARLYKTGDLARYLPDGNIEFVGRVDHQVKIRGFRIELEEIETQLEKHPGIKDAIVVAKNRKQDSMDSKIAGDKFLVGYFVPEIEDELTVKELRTFLESALPEYMIPAVFMEIDAVPLTPTGKIDLRALPEPDHSRPELESKFELARTEIEQTLADIWSEVIGLKEVGINDNFFELGGDSILSIQVISRATKAGIKLSPMQLFQNQTIAELAAVAGTAQVAHADQDMITGTVQLTPIQKRFFAHDLPEPQHWNQSMFFEVAERMDILQLKKVIQKILEHHDVLRLRFNQNDLGWEQKQIEMEENLPVSQIDFTALTGTELQSAIEATAAETQASLNLTDGPILRIVYFKLAEELHDHLLIVIHHLAVDGVSWRILLEDIQTAFFQAAQGREIALPPKTTSFQYWAQRLYKYAENEIHQTEIEYWLSLSQIQLPELPVDYPDGKNLESAAQRISVSLTKEETGSLLQDVPATYRTQINEILLTAVALAFGRWTGQRSILLNLEGHGREDLFEDVDLSRTVGWFTSIYPVYLDLTNAYNPADFIKSVKEQIRQIPNRGIGFGLLRYLNPDSDIQEKMSRCLTPEIGFNYLGQFNQTESESTQFMPAKASSGSDHSLQGTRQHLIDINGGISNGQLQMSWTFNENQYHRMTIDYLSQYFIEELRSIIQHCTSGGAGGYTPSDFPLAKLNQQKLGKILNKININKEVV